MSTVTLEKLTAWRDSLVESRLSGIFSVTDQNGERITYRTDSEMANAIAAADAAISAFGRRPVHSIHFVTQKGI